MKFNLLKLFQNQLPPKKPRAVVSPWQDRKVLAYFLSFQEIETLTRSTRRDSRQPVLRGTRLTLGSELFSPMVKSF